MKNYISEGRAVYEDINHGQFSKKLAEWAIGNMKTRESATDKLVTLKPTALTEVKELLKENNIRIDDSMIYSAWYLYNMTRADYSKSLTTDTQRVRYVEETLLDPDCCPEAVLECFTAKMCAMGIPIHWEDYL